MTLQKQRTYFIRSLFVYGIIYHSTIRTNIKDEKEKRKFIFFVQI